MNRIDRLQSILIQLQSKRVVTAQEIADRFEISVRTVYRDIRSLEEAGVPIGAEAGLGYYLSEHYNLPPIMFTDEEATALLFSAKFMEQLSDESILKPFESALFKIKAVLKSAGKDTMEALQKHISVWGGDSGTDAEHKGFLLDLQKCILGHSVVELTYRSKSAPIPTERMVEPIGLAYYGRYWHLIGYCRLREDYRDFRLDRLLYLRQTDCCFDPEARMELDAYFREKRSVEGLHQISLLVRRERAVVIKDSKFYYGFTHQEEADEENLRMFFRNSDLQGFARWVLLGAREVRVESPQGLLTILHQLVDELRAHYP